MKSIAIGVGGRFHSESLYTALCSQGHSVKVLTSYHKTRVNIPQGDIRSFPLAEIGYQIGRMLNFEDKADHFKMSYLGHRISKTVRRQHPDIFIGWSSFSLETLRQRSARTQILIRDSTHIDFQYAILRAEYAKHGYPFPQRQFCRERELEEYDLADQIWVLSDFARETFVSRGVAPKKVLVLNLGVDLERFPPRKIRQPTQPISIVYFGTISLRKGIPYLLEATKDINVKLTLIGRIEAEMKNILARYSHFKWMPPLDQNELAQALLPFDVFILPTLEDGFGQSLLQGMASGLVPITTTHCGAHTAISHRVNGFVVKPQNSSALKAVIQSLIDRSETIPILASRAMATARSFSWENYGQTLSHLLEPDKLLEKDVQPHIHN